MVKVKLRRFQFDSIPKDGRIILVIGRRGSGKSTLLEDILFHTQNRYDYTLGMSPTHNSIQMLERHMPREMVFDEGFSKEQFQKLIALSALIARKNKLRNGGLILDDCNADKEAFKSVTMRDAFMNGRQYGMNIVWAMHYCMDILPSLRTQVDYVFVLKDNIRKNKERLYNSFFGVFPRLDDFIKVMDQCTENNECLVLDNTKPNPDPKTCLFWYKAKRSEELPPFRLGKPIFYQLGQYFRKETPENEDLLNVHIRPGHQRQPVACGNDKNPRVECVEKEEEPPENEYPDADDPRCHQQQQLYAPVPYGMSAR